MPRTTRDRWPLVTGEAEDDVRLLLNPVQEVAWPMADAAGVHAFHRSIPGYAPTPLVHAPALAATLGVARVVVKDESSRLGLPAFKMLGASWAVHRLLCARAGLDPAAARFDDLVVASRGLAPLTLVTATDGNHGRAVARIARLLGLQADILVAGGTAAARIAAIAGEGAAVTVIDGTYDDAVLAAAGRAGSRRIVVSDTSWPGYDDVPRWVIDGYATIFGEIDQQLDGSPVHAVTVQMGVGALASAAARHYRRDGSAGRPWMLGVEPQSAACVMASIAAGALTAVPGPHPSIMAGLNCGLPSRVAFPDVRDAFDAFVAIDDRAACEAMRALAGLGLAAGETGAAGLAGLAAVVGDPATRAAVPLDDSSTVLVLCTEGVTDPVAYDRIVGSAVSR